MRDADHYPVELFWSEEDDGYIAIVPDLPGCSAFGETKAEATQEIDHAIAAWMEAATAAGNPIPSPTRRSSFSGKFVVRAPKTLHEQLVQRAKAEDVTLNLLVVTLLSQGLERAARQSIGLGPGIELVELLSPGDTLSTVHRRSISLGHDEFFTNAMHRTTFGLFPHASTRGIPYASVPPKKRRQLAGGAE